MNNLISLSLGNNDVSFLAKFPKDLMAKDEADVVSYILSYKAKYGKAPSTSRVIKEFPSYLFFGTPSDPIGDVYDMTVKKKIMKSMRMHLNAALIELDDGIIPTETVRKCLSVNALGGGLDNFSSFDRSQYFREDFLNTGISRLDLLTGGIGNGEVMILSGRLATGKSTVSQYFAYRWWEMGRKVLYVSNEMLTADVFSRIDAFAGKFNPRIFRSGSPTNKATKDALSRVEDALGRKGVGEIICPSLANTTPEEIFTLAQDLNVDCVVIDGVYLMSPDNGTDSRGVGMYARIGMVSNQIKSHTKRAKVKTIGVTQIKRGASDKSSYNPEDLSFSDSIGQDADFVVAIRPDETLKNYAELQLIKNRFGALGNTSIKFDFDSMSVTEESPPGSFGVVV